MCYDALVFNLCTLFCVPSMLWLYACFFLSLFFLDVMAFCIIAIHNMRIETFGARRMQHKTKQLN